MNESFLHFVWRHGLFDMARLTTKDGDPVSIFSPGMINYNAGPDFFNARIKIGKTVWAGNVEIHQHASDWYRHQHDQDPGYDNVILHVVKIDDRQCFNSKEQPVPSMTLMYAPHLEANYDELIRSKGWIACQQHFGQIDILALQIWFHGLMTERLQQKTSEIIERLQQNKNNWNETFYQFLARNFGFKTNSLPFEMLSKALPLTILARHKDNLFQIEALLFGTAGLLNRELIGDDYFLSLRQEFSFLYGKYKLRPLEGHLWKFLRMRPVNFPTVRIAQFAGLIHQSSALFSKLTEINDLEKLKKLFQTEASCYWTSHYLFNKKSPKKTKHLGNSSFYNIVINTIVPFLFVYGEYHHKPELKDLALDYLGKTPAENNSVIENWRRLGVPVRSAFDTQALMQLKNSYCNPKKCLNCPVGTKLISRKKLDTNEPANK